MKPTIFTKPLQPGTYDISELLPYVKSGVASINLGPGDFTDKDKGRLRYSVKSVLLCINWPEA